MFLDALPSRAIPFLTLGNSNNLDKASSAFYRDYQSAAVVQLPSPHRSVSYAHISIESSYRDELLGSESNTVLARKRAAHNSLSHDIILASLTVGREEMLSLQGAVSSRIPRRIMRKEPWLQGVR